MEPSEIAGRLSRSIDLNHYRMDANRNIYPLSVVNLVGSILGKGGSFKEQDNERQAFIGHLQGVYFHHLGFRTGEELRTSLGDPSDWSGPFVLPVFTYGAIAYLENKGILIDRDYFFQDLAIESLRPENDKLLRAIKFFGPEVLFWKMAGANRDYTTLTQIETRVDWLKRFNLINPQSKVVIVRTSNPDYVRDLESILGEEGKRDILHGDCIQTLSMYEHLLKSQVFYNDPDAQVTHDECEGEGAASCVYRLSFKPKHNILVQVLDIFRQGFIELLSGTDARQQLFDYEDTIRQKTAQIRRDQLALEDKNTKLLNALKALKTEYEGRDDDFVRTRRLLDDLARGPIHDAKNGFKSISPQVVTCQEELLNVLIRKYGHIEIDSSIINPILDDLESYLRVNDAQTLKRVKIDSFRERISLNPRILLGDLDSLNTNLLRPIFYSLKSSAFDSEDRTSVDTIRKSLYSIDTSCTSNCKILTDMILDPLVREDPIDVQIIPFVEELERKCALLFQDKQFDFEIGLDPMNLRFRKLRVESALYNLLRNAAEASPVGGKINVSLGKEENYIYFRIRNQGHIPEEILDNLTRGIPTSSKKEASTGSGTIKARETFLISGGSLEFRNLDDTHVEVEARLKI